VGKSQSEVTMPDCREVRRICGFLSVRQSRLHLDRVTDHRDRRGRRWRLDTLLFSTLLGIMTGQKSFADVERLTANLSTATRRLLGIRRSVPDTTLRDALSTVEPQELRPILHGATRSAHRSKTLSVDFDLPFGVVSMDGKYVSVPAVDDQYSQLVTHDADLGRLGGRIGTMTAVLSSCEARPCIDVYPIPAVTNEMGTFERALDALLAAYGQLDLFRLVTYDAGACSKANAQYIRDRGLHYLLSLKGSQPELSYWAQLWLGRRPLEQADAVNIEGTGHAQVTRRIFLAACPAAPDGWKHLRTLIRIDTDTFDRLGQPQTETFYYISSLAIDRLSPEQWLTAIRRHWAVETVHQILDGAFAEDDRPWVLENPRLTLVVMILRRIGYTLLTIFRSITQRSDERRQEPWRCLLQRIRDAVLLATASVLDGLRPRTYDTANC
jgi:predicted transposase YbfD/YdcC